MNEEEEEEEEGVKFTVTIIRVILRNSDKNKANIKYTMRFTYYSYKRYKINTLANIAYLL